MDLNELSITSTRAFLRVSVVKLVNPTKLFLFPATKECITTIRVAVFCSKFEAWWPSMSFVTSGVTPRFVVDGQAPMRQCLHSEACNKDIELPEHYNYFHDLRKDFVSCYSSHGELSTLGVQEMLQCILLILCTRAREFVVERRRAASSIVTRVIRSLEKAFPRSPVNISILFNVSRSYRRLGFGKRSVRCTRLTSVPLLRYVCD